MSGKPRDGLEPVRWRNNALEAIDQTKLPGRLVYLRLRTVDQVCSAIRSMKVRGAPLTSRVCGLSHRNKTDRGQPLLGSRTSLQDSISCDLDGVTG